MQAAPATLPFSIVDPHIHQWNPYTTPHRAALLVRVLGRYPQAMDAVARAALPRPIIDSLGLTQHALAPYLPADYHQDCGQYAVDAVVHVEADWHHQRKFGVVEETRWVAQLPFAGAHPRLGAIVATADPCATLFPALLRAHAAATPLFRGIRRMAAHHEDAGIKSWAGRAGLYSSTAFLRGFEHLSEQRLSFDAWGYSTQLPEITRLAEWFSNVPMVVNHLATPAGVFGPVGRFTGRSERDRAGIFSCWQHDIAELAQQKQVVAKLSGLLMPVLGHRFHEQGRRASVEEITELLAPFVAHAVAVFGPQRLMFASNFPMDKVTADLPDIITAMVNLIAPQGDAALKAIFRDNALAFYKIKPA